MKDWLNFGRWLCQTLWALRSAILWSTFWTLLAVRLLASDHRPSWIAVLIPFALLAGLSLWSTAAAFRWPWQTADDEEFDDD